MAFRQPPPTVYTPPVSKTFNQLIIIMTIIAVVVIMIITYISIRRVTNTKCRANIDCPTAQGKCDVATGACYQCLKTADCATGFYCSTAHTCV